MQTRIPKMSPIITKICVLLFLARECVCDRNCNTARIKELLKNPPAQWDVNALTESDINDFICSKDLISAAVSCLESYDAPECMAVPGLSPLVDQVTSRVGRGYQCLSCNAETVRQLVLAVRTIQKRFPREYVRGLASF